jgi:hypothetical protein
VSVCPLCAALGHASCDDALHRMVPTLKQRMEDLEAREAERRLLGAEPVWTIRRLRANQPRRPARALAD